MKTRKLMSFITAAAMILSLLTAMPLTASAAIENDTYVKSTTLKYDWYENCGITGSDDPNNPVVITINNTNNALKNAIAVSADTPDDINGGLRIISGYVRITGGIEIASIYRVRASASWAYKGPLITVKSGATLTLDNVTVTGKTQKGGAVEAVSAAVINYGTLNIGNGATVCDNNHTTGESDYGGGIYNKGTINMSGGTISGNTTGYGGGISNKGTFNMSGGTIIDNTVLWTGGGIYNSGTINMSGGTISGNTVQSGTGGGGIYNNGPLTIDGGAIYNNTIQSNNGHGPQFYNDADSSVLKINHGLIVGGRSGSYSGGSPAKSGTISGEIGTEVRTGLGLSAPAKLGDMLIANPADTITSTVGEKTYTGLYNATDKFWVFQIIPTEITLDKASEIISYPKQTSLTLTETVSPSDATDKTVTWTSSDTQVATVSGGTVTTKAAGRATITATTINGLTASCLVTVTNSVYTISYNKNDGTIANEDSFTRYTYSAGKTLPVPTKYGYTFGGWYANSGLTGTAVTSVSATETGDKTYYAKWTAKSYSITYNQNGGTIENEDSFTSYTYGIGKTLPTPTREGYTFGGWYASSYFTGTPVTSVSVTDSGSKIYYAKWTENLPTEFSVTYNGGVATVFSPQTGTFQLIFAAYNGTELQSVKIVPITFTAPGKQTAQAPTDFNIANATSAKIMLWEDMENAKPLCEVCKMK